MKDIGIIPLDSYEDALSIIFDLGLCDGKTKLYLFLTDEKDIENNLYYCDEPFTAEEAKEFLKDQEDNLKRS